MKDFFNRKNVAVTITLVVIAIALVIGFTSAPKQAATSTTSQTAASASSDAAGWAKKNYGQYEDFLEDDADLFSDTTLETFAKYNAQLDYTYGSIMGLVTTDDLDGKSMADYAIDESAELELGELHLAHIGQHGELVQVVADGLLLPQDVLQVVHDDNAFSKAAGDHIVALRHVRLCCFSSYCVQILLRDANTELLTFSHVSSVHMKWVWASARKQHLAGSRESGD